MSNNDNAPIRVTTPEAVLSYPALYEARKVDAQNATEKPKFSACFVFLKGTDLTQLKEAAIKAGQRKFGAKFKEMLENQLLRMPFRTDAVAKGYPEGAIFVNARSEQKPGLVMPYAGEDGRPAPVTDAEIMYPGAIVRGSLVAFGYDRAGNKGVSFALSNIQWLRDGERLDSRVAAADDFEPVEEAPVGMPVESDEGASLASLL